MDFIITGDTPTKLARLAGLLSPPRIAFFLGEKVEAYLHQRVRQRFSEEGDDASGKWEQLTAATQAIRSQSGYGAAHPINVRSGGLKDFIENVPGLIEIDPQGAMLTMPGTQPPGGVAKKFEGAQQGEGRAPARPVLAMSETDLAGVMSELEIYIRTGMGL